ncbi:proline-rich protein 4 [Phtheirospermum japonicum]|uniref:Proline-rich protein 4 n=1 Tax=Phtheirospermum japonicum TaxID=374723 RepID=A0A830BGC1_9LAMI|nr:proline-rich protein 4 [Phtheirospermum japonicum]
MRRVDSHCQSFLLLSLLLILFAVNLCSANDKSFEVVGTGECADCKENNFKTSQAFSGLRVTIDCKIKNGDMKRIGSTELDEQGNFKVSIPQDLVENGQKLKHECYAQLHSAAAIPCPAHNGLEASKIIFKSQTNNGKHVFVPTKTLQFSAALCTSKFFWPYFKYPPLPPLKHFGHPWLFPPLPPLYKPKPLPPPVPVYEPPVSKPLPPPAPVYKPEPPTPVYKPKPPTPVYKPEPKPKPPTPVYKPKPKPEPKPPTPVYKPKPKPEPKPKPPAPVYKPKPEPPVVKPPTPVYKPKPPGLQAA